MNGETVAPGAGTPVDKPETPQDFEFVIGRRQIASLTFVAVVALALAAGGSYLVGKATTVVAEAAPPAPVNVKAPPAPAPDSAVEAAPAPPPAPEPAARPIFDKPIKGVVYIQMGAVEKGIAEIFAEGLRRRGFDSFVAPGPNEKIFRVLIGPFRSSEEYSATKKSLDGMGLDTFARRYEE